MPADSEFAIEIATSVSDDLVAAFDRLIPQLSSSSPPPGADGLRAIVDNRDSALFVARIGGQIVGCLTLAMYRIPTGLKAWIEDVVVDEAARGRGIGEALNVAAWRRHAVAAPRTSTSRAARRGRSPTGCTSGSGFHRRDSNLYRYDF